MTKEVEFPDQGEARLVERVSVNLGTEGAGEIAFSLPRRTYDSIVKAARLAGEHPSDHLDATAHQVALAARLYVQASGSSYIESSISRNRSRLST